MKRLAPSGPSCCLSPGSPFVLAAAATFAAFAATKAAWIAPEEFCVECWRIFCVVAQFEGTPMDEAMDVVQGFATDNIVGMPRNISNMTYNVYNVSTLIVFGFDNIVILY